MPSEAELFVLCLLILLPSEPLLPELPSRASYSCNHHLVHPRPLLSTLWLPPVYVPPIHHHHVVIVIPSISRVSPFLSPFVSRVSFSSTPCYHRNSVEKLTRIVGQRIRNYDLSRRRDYLYSHVDFGILVPAPSSLCMYDHICGRIVLQRDAASWDFLRKFITKADNARHSNVSIRLIKDILRCV